MNKKSINLENTQLQSTPNKPKYR